MALPQEEPAEVPRISNNVNSPQKLRTSTWQHVMCLLKRLASGGLMRKKLGCWHPMRWLNYFKSSWHALCMVLVTVSVSCNGVGQGGAHKWKSRLEKGLFLWTKEASSRKRAEYGFGENGFKHRTQWVFLALTEFLGESSVRSSQPIICVPSKLTEFFCRTHRVYPKLQWALFSETVFSKTVFRPFPKVSLSVCHFFLLCSWDTPLNKRRGILSPSGAFRGAFQKDHTCFPLFCCVCDLWTSVILVRVQGEVPRALPGAHETACLRVTLWTWHLDALEHSRSDQKGHP